MTRRRGWRPVAPHLIIGRSSPRVRWTPGRYPPSSPGACAARRTTIGAFGDASTGARVLALIAVVQDGPSLLCLRSCRGDTSGDRLQGWSGGAEYRNAPGIILMLRPASQPASLQAMFLAAVPAWSTVRRRLRHFVATGKFTPVHVSGPFRSASATCRCDLLVNISPDVVSTALCRAGFARCAWRLQRPLSRPQTAPPRDRPDLRYPGVRRGVHTARGRARAQDAVRLPDLVKRGGRRRTGRTCSGLRCHIRLNGVPGSQVCHSSLRRSRAASGLDASSARSGLPDETGSMSWTG
jgi:hypothetical protein